MHDAYTCDDVKYLNYIIDKTSNIMNSLRKDSVLSNHINDIMKIERKLTHDLCAFVCKVHPSPDGPVMFDPYISIIEDGQLKNCNYSNALGSILAKSLDALLNDYDISKLHNYLCFVRKNAENYINAKGLNK